MWSFFSWAQLAKLSWLNTSAQFLWKHNFSEHQMSVMSSCDSWRDFFCSRWASSPNQLSRVVSTRLAVYRWYWLIKKSSERTKNNRAYSRPRKWQWPFCRLLVRTRQFFKHQHQFFALWALVKLYRPQLSHLPYLQSQAKSRHSYFYPFEIANGNKCKRPGPELPSFNTP